MGGALDKGGTSEGADRGWKTRRKQMAAVEPELAGPRARAEEDEPAGRRRRAEEDVAPAMVADVSDIPDVVKALAARIGEAGGRALLVGGYVRDMARGAPGEEKDFDLEVYGMDPDALQATLGEVGRVDAVGKSFGVLKMRLGDLDLDISVPRRESKTGKGHRGFMVTPDPTMTITEAAKRRDFTFNTMAMDPETGEVYDPFDGLADVEAGVIRATDPETFVEDPLRVLRAAQFAARFGFDVHEDTIELCRSIREDLRDLPSERVGAEWQKLLMRSDRPSVGLDVMERTGALETLHPEMAAQRGVPQDPRWHPEGDVWTHVKMVVDAAVEAAKQAPPESRRVIIYAALLHDISKPQTTETQPDGSITSRGHEEAGGPEAQRIARDQLDLPKGEATRIAKLVEDHLAPKMLYRDREKIGKGTVKRLAKRLAPATIEELVAVSRADGWGRTTPDALARRSDPEDWLLEAAREQKVESEAPKPILQGRHLIARGVKSGPEMGELLRRVYELQVDGKVNDLDEALEAAGVKEKSLAAGLGWRRILSGGIRHAELRQCQDDQPPL